MDKMTVTPTEWVERVASRLQVELGATAVEYALMLALIAAVIVAAAAFLGQSTNSGYDNFGSSFASAGS